MLSGKYASEMFVVRPVNRQKFSEPSDKYRLDKTSLEEKVETFFPSGEVTFSEFHAVVDGIRVEFFGVLTMTVVILLSS